MQTDSTGSLVDSIPGPASLQVFARRLDLLTIRREGIHPFVRLRHLHYLERRREHLVEIHEWIRGDHIPHASKSTIIRLTLPIGVAYPVRAQSNGNRSRLRLWIIHGLPWRSRRDESVGRHRPWGPRARHFNVRRPRAVCGSIPNINVGVKEGSVHSQCERPTVEAEQYVSLLQGWAAKTSKRTNLGSCCIDNLQRHAWRSLRSCWSSKTRRSLRSYGSDLVP